MLALAAAKGKYCHPWGETQRIRKQTGRRGKYKGRSQSLLPPTHFRSPSSSPFQRTTGSAGKSET